MISNPSYKGPWIPPKVKNPAYKVVRRLQWTSFVDICGSPTCNEASCHMVSLQALRG